MKAFLLALLSLFAVVTFVNAADNGVVLGKYLTPFVNGKYGQLNTNIRDNLFIGFSYSNAEKKELYAELKVSIGKPIGQIKYSVVRSLPKVIDAIIKKGHGKTAKHVAMIIDETAAIVKADMAAQNAELFNAIWKSFDKRAGKVLGNKYTNKARAQFQANIKKTVKFWSQIQSKSFCKVHCDSPPASVLNQLH